MEKIITHSREHIKIYGGNDRTGLLARGFLKMFNRGFSNARIKVDENLQPYIVVDDINIYLSEFKVKDTTKN